MSFKEKAQELLKSTTVASLPAPAKIVVVDSKAGLYDGFETLVKSNVLSAPVFDKSTNSYVGFLDIRDLVSFVVFCHDEQKVTNDTRLRDLVQHGTGLYVTAGAAGVSITYLARRNAFSPVQSSDSLQSVARILSKGVHRVPVLTNGIVTNIISQSTLIKFVADELQKIILENSGPSIAELGIGSSPVHSVTKSTSVIATFRAMDNKKRSGIALVDESGRLVGTTTGKDLGLFLDNPTLAALNRPIFEHLQLIRSQQNDIKTPAIAIFEKDSLSRALGLIAATRVHRVFVVDSESTYRPIKVVSITDLLKYIVE